MHTSWPSTVRQSAANARATIADGRQTGVPQEGSMKFAMFYEIPVPRPWTERSEYWAYKNTIEQAVLGDQVGFHSFWTVEHHFLEEY